MICHETGVTLDTGGIPIYNLSHGVALKKANSPKGEDAKPRAHRRQPAASAAEAAIRKWARLAQERDQACRSL